ncbi:MAG: DUF6262 family protein [Actinomycetota bacterium]|nr:DUF6262 family protein [Actinomycetota bacterium]
MRADNTAFIIAAAHDRREATLGRAHAALVRLDRTGATVTFQAVAEAASVSRAWLYREPTLRAEIERLRGDRANGHTTVLPSAQRASNESLKRRLEALGEQIAHLKQENHHLREQVARLHGERRASDTRPRPARPTAP